MARARGARRAPPPCRSSTSRRSGSPTAAATRCPAYRASTRALEAVLRLEHRAAVGEDGRARPACPAITGCVGVGHDLARWLPRRKNSSGLSPATTFVTGRWNCWMANVLALLRQTNVPPPRTNCSKALQVRRRRAWPRTRDATARPRFARGRRPPGRLVRRGPSISDRSSGTRASSAKTRTSTLPRSGALKSSGCSSTYSKPYWSKQPARPALVHAAGPRLEEADARLGAPARRRPDVRSAVERQRLDQRVLLRLARGRDDDVARRPQTARRRPCVHARLMARNALFCAGIECQRGPPEPVMRPGGGTMAAADGLDVEARPRDAVERRRVRRLSAG